MLLNGREHFVSARLQATNTLLAGRVSRFHSYRPALPMAQPTVCIGEALGIDSSRSLPMLGCNRMALQPAVRRQVPWAYCCHRESLRGCRPSEWVGYRGHPVSARKSLGLGNHVSPWSPFSHVLQRLALITDWLTNPL